MKSTLLLGMMSIVSADVCTDPLTTRETFIESQCCSKTCQGESCTAGTECVSGDCRLNCCVENLNDANCLECSDVGSCQTCAAGFSLLDAIHPDAGSWSLQDQTLLGEAANNKFGSSMAMSKDGKIVAIGAPFNTGQDDNGDSVTRSGHVRVFYWDDSTSTWKQRGGDVDGSNSYDQFGYSLDLNADGTVLAVGAIDHDIRTDTGSITTSRVGHARIYDWTGTTWSRRGDDIEGDIADDKLGMSVSLSHDGNVVAVGIPKKQGLTPNLKGRVTVFYWDAGWQQKGSHLEGLEASDESGESVSLSADGNRVAFTREGYSETVDVYTYANGDWGDKKTLPMLDHVSSVDLSPDGSTVAIAAKMARNADGSTQGNVKVYAFDDNGNLVQKGQDLDNFLVVINGALIGSSVSLNEDGTAIAIGASRADSSTLTTVGQVVVFDWTGQSWRKRSDIFGDVASIQIGHVVKLSEDGSQLAISSIEANSRTGEAKIYSWDSACTSAFTTDCCVADA